MDDDGKSKRQSVINFNLRLPYRRFVAELQQKMSSTAGKTQSSLAQEPELILDGM